MLVKTLVVVAGLLVASSLTTWAETCKSDNNCDGKVDITDLVRMRGEYFRDDCDPVCSVPVFGGVPKTGQTTSYGTGDDGDLEKGVPWPNPRFTDNLDGTVTDNLTGLIWLKDANCFGAKLWTEALSDANGLASGSCGLTDGSIAGDWRLPNYKELFSLVDAENSDPALPSGHPFTNVQSYMYWCSWPMAECSTPIRMETTIMCGQCVEGNDTSTFLCRGFSSAGRGHQE